LGSPFALVGKTPGYIDDTGDNEADPQSNSNAVDAAEMPVSFLVHPNTYSAGPVKYISFNEEFPPEFFYAIYEAYLFIA